MANELSLNQTVQGEVGEFNYLYVNQEEVDMQAINDSIASIASIESRVSQNETNIQTLTDAINDTNGNVSNLTARVVALENAPFDATPIYDRLTALEASSFDTSVVDNLSTSVTALQTRIGTLESLIGLLTNNNTNDTGIEHRLTNLERKINALVSVYQSVKAIHNMPIDL